MGVEGLVAEELRGMGCEEVRADNGRVFFSGGPEILARVNICSRYAERVMLFLCEFRALTFEELFEKTKAIPWEDYIPKEAEFPVSGSSLNSKLHSVPDCQAIMKKAVVERLKQKYKIGWFPETGALYKIRFLILKDSVSVMIDTSGPGLHKRGYRKNSNDAPIKETLAASLVKLARVREDGTFYDPFCGSGTILIEAAMYALNIAPGRKRKFVSEDWHLAGRKTWLGERERASALERKDAKFTGTGYDIDSSAVELSMENAKKAGVLSQLNISRRAIKDFNEETQYGVVICNPPYGERLLPVKEVRDIYKAMGAAFQSKRGWSYSVITPDEEFEKLFGRRADKKRKLYNGMIKCQFYMYFK